MFPRDRALPLRRGLPGLTVRLSTLLVAGVVFSGIATGPWSLGLIVTTIGAAIALHGAIRIFLLRRRGTELLAIELSLLGPLIDPAADASTPEIETRESLIAASVPAGVLALASLVMSLWSPAVLHPAVQVLGGYAVLHVMPGLPMDGGRLFHALVWYVSGSPTVATRAAARYAQLIAGGLIVTGLFMLPLGGLRSYWSILFLGMGWQLSAAAVHDAARSTWQRRGRTATLDRFIPGVILPPTGTVAHAARLILGRRVPVLVGDGRNASGVVTQESLRRVPRAEWHQRPLADIMTAIDLVPQLPVNRTVAEAATLLRNEGQTVLVVTAGGRPRAAVLLEQLLAPLPR